MRSTEESNFELKTRSATRSRAFAELVRQFSPAVRKAVLTGVSYDFPATCASNLTLIRVPLALKITLITWYHPDCNSSPNTGSN